MKAQKNVIKPVVQILDVLNEAPTVVVFRMFKDGDVVALFPEIVNYPDGCVESYQHVGQHGAASYHHCIKISRPATPEEYAPLAKELERIGRAQTRSYEKMKITN